MKQMVYIIIDDEITPSGNVLLRMHWSRRKNLSDIWFTLIRANSRGSDWHKPMKTKKKVTVIRNAPRVLDDTNMRISVDKLILDNIKSKVRRKLLARGGYVMRDFITDGLLYDDSPEYLDLDCQQKKSKRKFTEIIVEDVE